MTDQDQTPINPKPIVVLVHGAWHRPFHLAPIANVLHKHGYITHSPALPSVSDGKSTPLPLTSHSADTATIHAVLSALVNDGREIVLFIHSYGGIPASDAVAGLTRTDRKKANLPGGVVHIVWCAAFALLEGQSLFDSVVASSSPPDWFDVVDLPPDHGPGAGMLAILKSGKERSIFYNDIDNKDEFVDHAVQQLGHASAQAYMSKQKYSAWRDVSGTYIHTLDDNCNLPAQKLILKQISEEQEQGRMSQGVDMEVVTLQSGHTPWFRSDGLELIIKLIRKAAGEL